MTAITKTDDRISLLDVERCEVFNAYCGVTIARGQAVFINTSTGRLALSNAGSAGTTLFAGIALDPGGAGQAISVLKRGRIAGFAPAGNYMSSVYLNDTDGVVGDAAGTNSKVIGKVVPLTDNYAAPSKVIYIDADQWLHA